MIHGILRRKSKIALLLIAVVLLCLPASVQAGYLLFGNADDNTVKRFDATTGSFLGNFVTPGSGGITTPHGMAFGPDGNLYVADYGGGSQVNRYSGTNGTFLNVFASGNGLNAPDSVAFGSDGNLYVSSQNTNEVKRFDGVTGAFIDNFVTAGSGGLNTADGLVFGPDGNLYVSSFNSGEVLRYDGSTGAFMDVFASGGGLGAPNGIGFGPDGNLYVADFFNSAILRYDGATGAFIDTFASGHGLNQAFGFAFGPGGNLFVSNSGPGGILRFDGSGTFVDQFIDPSDLSKPTYLIFVTTPEPGSLTLLSLALISFGGMAWMKKRNEGRSTRI